jgi:hypothetical protein
VRLGGCCGLGRRAGGELAGSVHQKILHPPAASHPTHPNHATLAAGDREVHLLKVDVERAELAVLQGVKAEDWPRIAQVAVEVREP